MKQYKEGWELPNPFLNAEGKLVENPKEWEKQREYLKSLLIRYQYGTVPPAPPFYREEAISKKELLEGAGIEENIRLYFGPKGEITFRIIVLRPNDRPADHGGIRGMFCRGGFPTDGFPRNRNGFLRL